MITKEECTKIILERAEMFNDIFSRSENEKELEWQLKNTGATWALELEELYTQYGTEETYDEVVDMFVKCAMERWKKIN